MKEAKNRKNKFSDMWEMKNRKKINTCKGNHTTQKIT